MATASKPKVDDVDEMSPEELADWTASLDEHADARGGDDE